MNQEVISDINQEDWLKTEEDREAETKASSIRWVNFVFIAFSIDRSKKNVWKSWSHFFLGGGGARVHVVVLFSSPDLAFKKKQTSFKNTFLAAVSSQCHFFFQFSEENPTFWSSFVRIRFSLIYSRPAAWTQSRGGKKQISITKNSCTYKRIFPFPLWLACTMQAILIGRKSFGFVALFFSFSSKEWMKERKARHYVRRTMAAHAPRQKTFKTSIDFLDIICQHCNYYCRFVSLMLSLSLLFLCLQLEGERENGRERETKRKERERKKERRERKRKMKEEEERKKGRMRAREIALSERKERVLMWQPLYEPL